MAIFKCKMCGGDLDVQDESTVCECEYCGTKQTIPSMDNEKKVNLFNRANRLRYNCEFDKASGVYESIAAEFPEESEAYWGLCLCKYGIEYVDDPATAKKIPTCHRTSYDSIFQDGNFEMACEYADSVARQIYRSEAKEIERLQKEILDIAKNEEPFDIFICYKETAPDGQRTKDSVLAQDIYDALTAKDYKVFFSRITLEDKLGQDYEPYIFSALNSAKVMLAIGTDYEYFNAVWVKNEWSRFLALMSKDKSKTIIPCYCDIDAYDMPEEFRRLQGQDMSKVGFVQDLVRGVGKIISANDPLNTTTTIHTNISDNVSPLIERIHIFLDDGNWEKANEYCEKVLDIEPKRADVYLLKVFSDYHVIDIDSLVDLEVDFGDNRNFLNAMKYSSYELKDEMTAKYNIVKEKIFEKEYNLYKKMLNEAITPDEFDHIICQLNKMPTNERYNELLANAKAKKLLTLYQIACQKRESMQLEEIVQAIELFRQIPEYSDAQAQAKQLSDILEDEYRKSLRNAIISRTNQEYSDALKKLKELDKYRSCGIVTEEITEINKAYRKAMEYSHSALMKKVSEAVEIFESLSDRIDTSDNISYCRKRINDEYFNAIKKSLSDKIYEVDDASLSLKDLGEYKYSPQILACVKQKASLMIELAELSGFSLRTNKITKQLKLLNDEINRLSKA